MGGGREGKEAEEKGMGGGNKFSTGHHNIGEHELLWHPLEGDIGMPHMLGAMLLGTG